MNGKRLAAGFIDFVIAGVLQAILIFTLIIFPVFFRAERISIGYLINLTLVFTLLNYMFLRDILGGAGLGKRVLGLKVIDSKTGEKAAVINCLLRNITLIIWPIEVVVLLVKGSRLGDMLAGTDVVEI